MSTEKESNELELSKVHKVAVHVPSLRLQSVNNKLNVITFDNTETKCRFVVYAKGIVVITSTDPLRVGSQVVHRKVNYRDLVDLFKEPARIHFKSDSKTVGVKRRSDEPSTTTKPIKVTKGEEECEFDEPVVKKASSFIKPSHLEGKRQIIEIETRKEEDKRWHAPVLVPPKRDPPPTTVAPEARAATTELSRKVNARGNNCFWKLRHHTGFPESVHSVACIAIAQGGFVAVMDDGTCVWDGIPAKVASILEGQYRRNIAYVALGECGQHYILLKNGREFYAGPPSFEKAIRGAKSIAKVVTFGDSVSYFVQFEDGTRDWNAPFSRRAENILKDCRIFSLWIGTPPPSRGAPELPYFVSYQPSDRHTGTLHSFAGLPYEVNDWITYKTQKSTQIKQILTDGDCFVIRYS